jgi:hypothetical protein
MSPVGRVENLTNTFLLIPVLFTSPASTNLVVLPGLLETPLTRKRKRQECNVMKTFLATYKYSFFTVHLVMREGTEIVMLTTVLFLLITLFVQGSVFDGFNGVGKSLTNIAAAITYLQNYGITITGNNLELPFGF